MAAGSPDAEKQLATSRVAAPGQEQPAPSAEEILAHMRAKTRPLLLSRANAACWIMLAGTATFSVAKLWFEPATPWAWFLPPLWLAAIQVLFFRMLRRATTATRLERIMLVNAAAACAAIAWGGVVAGRTIGSDFVLMGLAMFGAAIVPWRPSFQAAAAAMAALAILANGYAVNGSLFGAVDFRTFVPGVVLLGASVYTSYAFELAGFKSARADLLRRRAEAQTRELHASLERRVVERTAEYQAANDELEAFSHSVSHDLRTPLRAMDALSQALLEDYSATLDDEAKDYLRRIRGETGRLGELIDDLLRLSHVTRSVMRREEVDLSTLALIEAEKLRSSRPERNVQFSIDPGLREDCDGSLVRVLLENLLGNAFKFTQKKPQARIEFRREQQNGSRYYVVRDNGVGFDMAHVGRIFGAFERLHSAEDFEGTGIGLTTADRIVRRHGGTIVAEAKPEEGATFRFTLGPVGETA